MMTRSDNQLPAAGSRRRARRTWLGPLLWLLVPALAAVAPWAWQRGRAPQRSPHRPLPPLALTGDARRDRRAILERAADLLWPEGSMAVSAGGYLLPSGAPLLGEIGLELLPLDPARGTKAVRLSIETESGPRLHEASELTAPEWTHVGMLVRLARSLRQYPDLAERALQTAYGEAQRHQVAVE